MGVEIQGKKGKGRQNEILIEKINQNKINQHIIEKIKGLDQDLDPLGLNINQIMIKIENIIKTTKIRYMIPEEKSIQSQKSATI